MDLERASHELYGIEPGKFTAARDVMAAEARADGQPQLAAALKKLRKPSVGAWLANLTVRERLRDVERLIALGEGLRALTVGGPDGDQIRTVTKEKTVTIAALVRAARAIASRRGQPVSQGALEEFEATLDAAFADTKAAEELHRGQLTRGLRYSGLGFGDHSPAGSGPRKRKRPTTNRRALERAEHDAQRADSELEQVRTAVAAAEDELRRLRKAEAAARRRAQDAHEKVSSAKKRP